MQTEVKAPLIAAMQMYV